MTPFALWVAEVQAIAGARQLDLTTTYPRPDWATFNWRARNGSRYGSGGAGAEFISLTSPAEYTWDWYAGPDPAPGKEPPPVHPVIDPVPPIPWERHGRFVPRVPAMAVSAALIELFKVR